MRTDILIATYLQDLPYLRHSLNSIRKFATGFGGVTLAVAKTEEGAFRTEFPDVELFSYDRHPDPVYGQLHAQAVKCLGDVCCPKSDFVLHLDSDCVFIEPVTPEDYFVECKPVMLMQPYSELPRDIPWRYVTEKVLGRKVEYEFMRRHPQVNPFGVYSDLRGHICNRHKKPFEQWVLEQKPTFPWGFSEHNAIGAFAWYNQTWHDAYHWINLSDGERPKDKVYQAWNHSPPELEQNDPNGGRTKPIDIYNRLGI